MAGTYEQSTIGEARSVADPKWLAQFKGMNEKLSSSNLLEDSGLASPNNAAYRTLLSARQTLGNDRAAATYPMFSTAGITAASGTEINASTMVALPFFYFDDADYTVAGKTQKLRVRAQIACNATKPLIKFTVGLYPVTVAGVADNYAFTLGTVVSGSTVEFNEPAASTIAQGNSGDFTIPSDGAYALGIVTSTTLTNNSATLLSAQLQTRNV